jgi:thiol-disulfide isomerase/thioredoxin
MLVMLIRITTLLVVSLALANSPRAQTSLPPSVLKADIQNLKGGSFRLSEGTAKVKIIFLWTSWCGPCRFAAKDLNQVYRAYPESDVEIIGLTNENPQADGLKVRNFVRKNRMKFKVGWLNSEMEKVFTREKYPGLVPIIVVLNGERQLDSKFIGYKIKVTPRKLIDIVDRIMNKDDGKRQEPSSARPNKALQLTAR